MNKKLSDVLELPIKIDVSSLTEEERGELQKELFSVGVIWRYSGRIAMQLDSEEYYINKCNELTQSNDRCFFHQHSYKQISVQQLKEKIKMCKQFSKSDVKSSFSKSDLKDGMVVLLRGSNDRHLVINNRFVAHNGWADFDLYDNNLLKNEVFDNEFDVMEVFEVIRANFLRIEDWQLKSIWKREELSERDKQIISIREKMLELEKQLETLQDAKQQ